MNKFTYIFFSIITLLLTTQFAISAAVLDVANPTIKMSKSTKRDYVKLQNIGDKKGTFIITITNITNPKTPIVYSNKDLKKLPLIIKPIIIVNMRPTAKKRITLTRNPRIKIKKPIKLMLTIKEYVKPNQTKKTSKGDAGIKVQGSILNTVNIEMS